MAGVTHTRAIHIFRRDLRLVDNTALSRAVRESAEVIPVFIFDEAQRDPMRNPYFSERAFAFMCRSLEELQEELHGAGSALRVFSGDPIEVVRTLIARDHVDAVYVNGDYTPFARTRDAALERVCREHNAAFVRCEDAALSPVCDIRTQGGVPYTVFTPFFRNAAQSPVALPRRAPRVPPLSAHLHTPHRALHDATNDVSVDLSHMPAGREAGRKVLRAHAWLAGYAQRRDAPAVVGTSRLSPHHKFGTVSIRESFAVANRAGTHDAAKFVAELYWRDFYYHIAWHFPQVFGKSFLPWGEHIEWRNNRQEFDAWRAGRTGVPIVDAGMRELNTTGWMHNRVRMIVASFLTKNLLIDWRWGERYFATQLVDYDPAQNNGGWQWSASVGADPRPLRIFNPYMQAQKYDPSAEYIKAWLPELRDVETALLVDGRERDLSACVKGYPAPIVSARESYHRAREVYRAAKDSSTSAAT